MCRASRRELQRLVIDCCLRMFISSYVLCLYLRLHSQPQMSGGREGWLPTRHDILPEVLPLICSDRRLRWSISSDPQVVFNDCLDWVSIYIVVRECNMAASHKQNWYHRAPEAVTMVKTACDAGVNMTLKHCLMKDVVWWKFRACFRGWYWCVGLHRVGV